MTGLEVTTSDIRKVAVEGAAQRGTAMAWGEVGLEAVNASGAASGLPAEGSHGAVAGVPDDGAAGAERMVGAWATAVGWAAGGRGVGWAGAVTMGAAGVGPAAAGAAAGVADGAWAGGAEREVRVG